MDLPGNPALSLSGLTACSRPSVTLMHPLPFYLFCRRAALAGTSCLCSLKSAGGPFSGGLQFRRRHQEFIVTFGKLRSVRMLFLLFVLARHPGAPFFSPAFLINYEERLFRRFGRPGIKKRPSPFSQIRIPAPAKGKAAGKVMKMNRKRDFYRHIRLSEWKIVHKIIKKRCF